MFKSSEKEIKKEIKKERNIKREVDILGQKRKKEINK